MLPDVPVQALIVIWSFRCHTLQSGGLDALSSGQRGSHIPRESGCPAGGPPRRTHRVGSARTLAAHTTRILDERWQDHAARLTAGGPSAEEIAKHVWGPWEFNTGASAQVADNQTTHGRSYSRSTGQDWDRLSLVPSAPPYWASGMTTQQWLLRHDGQPIRLMISCRLGEYRWELPYDVPISTSAAP
jgi:hypothetical protein